MVLATLTGSADGGMVLADAPNVPEEMQGLYLNWANTKDKEKEIIEDASGFKVERKHFPADSRKDCWFCLASESCAKHLITGVYSTEGHILLILVQHSSQSSLKDQAVAEEMEELKSKLRRHPSEAYDKDLFVFERAIQTKGGYHTHVQCIPVPRKLGIKIHAAMLAQARKSGFDLRELNSDLGLASVLAAAADVDEGYFYAEIPGARSQAKRFLYKANGRTVCPLLFGCEVVAAVEGNPDLAHLNACVVDQEQEAKLATAFRESFAKYAEST